MVQDPKLSGGMGAEELVAEGLAYSQRVALRMLVMKSHQLQLPSEFTPQTEDAFLVDDRYASRARLRSACSVGSPL